jgi:hypothetical protein
VTPPSVNLGSIVAGLVVVFGIALLPFGVVMVRLGTHQPGPRFTLSTAELPTFAAPVLITLAVFLVMGALAIGFMSAASVRHTAKA